MAETMSLTYKGDGGAGYACDDPKYADSVALLVRMAEGGSGYGVDTSDLDPRPLQAVLADLAAMRERLEAAKRLANDMVEVAQAKVQDDDTPADGFLGRTYWQGQKDTARRILVVLAGRAEGAEGGESGTRETA